MSQKLSIDSFNWVEDISLLDEGLIKKLQRRERDKILS